MSGIRTLDPCWVRVIFRREAVEPVLSSDQSAYDSEGFEEWGTGTTRLSARL
ncbi:hypothetical protein ACIBJF_50175 [Streptomyces sp. NPDC050743]|uniref:hypothetical protein n=1 Tax=Streptomyces sp. NPDC050743 TaxID=3365634 RepID=UPI0037B0AB41